MTTLKDYKKSSIVAANAALTSSPARPDRARGALLSRGAFTDEQLESAGASGSVNIARGTINDFCKTRDWCTTYTTTCIGMVPGLTP